MKCAPWISDNIGMLITLRSKARTKWKRTKNPSHYDYYKMLRNYSTLACRREQKAYFEFFLGNNGLNDLWEELKHLNITKKNSDTIPECLKEVNVVNNYYINGIPRVQPKQEEILYYRKHLHPVSGEFILKITTEDEVPRC